MPLKLLSVISVFCLLSNVVFGHLHLDWDPSMPAFDPAIYENLLDPELCREQLDYLATNNTLMRLQFIEAGLRIPRGILMGNNLDLGNYLQCLRLNEEIPNSVIEGKYCMINVPIGINMASSKDLSEDTYFDPSKLKMDEITAKQVEKLAAIRRGVNALIGAGKDTRTTTELQFSLAVCIPTTCTTQEGISGLFFNLNAIDFPYEDSFCRIKNDKPWAPADYISITFFSLIGFLTLLSTSYDVWHTFVLKSNPKSISTPYRTFSMYTNTRRLLTFTKNPGSIECLDGIRALSMMWVIIGHTFATLPDVINVIDTLDWIQSFRSLWIVAGPIAVDTFFVIGGLLLVYTAAGKLTGIKLLKSLHFFYLNRLLRMFPLLLAAVLLQISILHRVADGPLWNTVAANTNVCRTYWWSTLLYIQNYANTETMCLGHTWYLAIDIQLHILSPLILFWVLGRSRKVAWAAMTIALLSFQIPATIYNFMMEFRGNVIAIARPQDDYMFYMVYYYLNTLTRAAPFLIGMMYGYIFHMWRGKDLEISRVTATLLWACALGLTTAAFYAIEPMKYMDWDNQTVDSLVNSFMRPAWAIGLGWIIFACAKGYAGPIDWFLSLQVWKLPSRLSYGMYLFHYPIQFVMTGTALAPIFYTEVETVLVLFLNQLVVAFLVSFALTLLLDSPMSTLIKMLLGGGPKKPQNEAVESTKDNNNTEKNTYKSNGLRHRNKTDDEPIPEKYVIKV